MQAAQSGDRGALDQLCAACYPEVQVQVHNALRRDYRGRRPWLSTLFSTGDVVHDVFLGVVRDLDRFRGSSRLEFVGYLAKLTRNRLIDVIRFHEAGCRDERRVQHSADLSAEPNGPPPEVIAMTAEEAARVNRVLDSFSERDRALLRGRLEDGDTFEQLARSLGYASADSARKMFHTLQARLLLRLRRGEA
ncbi:MAG: sigma-70 family RNA polymerase sigma factor [Planctomycetes bacterium]|nr:sigma-70 family RNA polymerase sigma factor [Planctomycetota bacterium]